jgi:hypothetical protein
MMDSCGVCRNRLSCFRKTGPPPYDRADSAFRASANRNGLANRALLKAAISSTARLFHLGSERGTDRQPLQAGIFPRGLPLCLNRAILHEAFNTLPSFSVQPALLCAGQMKTASTQGEDCMRAKRVIVGSLIVGTAGAVSAAGLTHEREIVLEQRAKAEWAALSLMNQSLRDGQAPLKTDAAVFLSNSVIDKALKQLIGATITSPAAEDLKIVVKDVRSQPSVGWMGVAAVLELSSVKYGWTVPLDVDGDLIFKGVGSKNASDQGELKTADFAISILKFEPHLKLGFIDLPGRHLVSEVISTGLMRTLDKVLIARIPFEDRLALNTGIDQEMKLLTDTSDGSVTIKTTLPAKELEQRFAVATPMFIGSGVWLVANLTKNGQPQVSAPSAPEMTDSDLRAKIETLRSSIADATKGLDQSNDIVLWVKGTALVGLADQLKNLPPLNRTVTLQSVGETGQLESDGKSYVELSNPSAATANIVLDNLDAKWIPKKGAELSLDFRADMTASVHAHLGLGGGVGTTFGAERHREQACVRHAWAQPKGSCRTFCVASRRGDALR